MADPKDKKWEKVAQVDIYAPKGARKRSEEVRVP